MSKKIFIIDTWRYFLAGALAFGVLVAYSGVGATITYFSDKESSDANNITSIDLNLGILPLDYTPLGKSEALLPGDTVSRTIEVADMGNLPFQYNVQSTNFIGDQNLCGVFNLLAKLNGHTVYSGALNSFHSAATTTLGTWTFDVGVPASHITADEFCDFNFEFDAWQQNTQTFLSSGFRDNEIAPNHLVSVPVPEVEPPPAPQEDLNGEEDESGEHEEQEDDEEGEGEDEEQEEVEENQNRGENNNSDEHEGRD